MTDVVEVVTKGSEPRESTWGVELARLERQDKEERPAGVHDDGLCVIFGSAQGLYDSAGEGSTEHGLVSGDFLERVRKDLNGSYGSRPGPSGPDGPKSYSVWYCFKIKQVLKRTKTTNLTYHWQQISSFITYYADGRPPFVLCIGCPKKSQPILVRKLLSSSMRSIATWHDLLLQTMRDLYDQSVWSLRDCVRDTEIARAQNLEPDFIYLHEVARHLIHSDETLDVAIDTVKRVRGNCEHPLVDLGARSSDKQEDMNHLDRIHMSEKDIKSIKRRSESLQERLHNEINLGFNLVAQQDNRIMVQMGEKSREENNYMRSIAVVGLVYLPGTFVSALFGMNFFLFENEAGRQEWKVSDKFWMYWAITIPLTLATVVIWVLAFHGKELKAKAVKKRYRKDLGKTNGV